MVFQSTVVIVVCDPTINTIAHENTSTTAVRIAVATVESVLRIPHFARMDVTPAKSADKNAKAIHIYITKNHTRDFEKS